MRTKWAVTVIAAVAVLCGGPCVAVDHRTAAKTAGIPCVRAAIRYHGGEILYDSTKSLSITGTKDGKPPDATAVARLTAVAERVQTVVNRLADCTALRDPSNWPWVLYSGGELEGNAFCCVAGAIGVSAGILTETAGDDDYLAFCLAHEMSHYINGDRGKDPEGPLNEDEVLARLRAARPGPSPRGEVLNSERMADMGGISLMHQAGYDPMAALRLTDDQLRDLGALACVPVVGAPLAIGILAIGELVDDHGFLVQRRIWLSEGVRLAMSRVREGAAIAVFAPQESPASREALTRTLAGEEADVHVFEVGTLEEAAASEVDVLVLVMGRAEEAPVSEDTLAALRGRRVIGIGYGAAQLFHQLGLEIRAGLCCGSAYELSATISIQSGGLLGEPHARQVRPYIAPWSGGNADEHFQMYIPPNSAMAEVAEVIARVSGHPSEWRYAAIARQDNYVLSGIHAPATNWTPEYRALLHRLAAELRSRPLGPFPRVEWPLTEPGRHELALGSEADRDCPHEGNFFFRFAEPTTFSARLTHTGSAHLMLLFMGRKNRLHWTRVDATNGEPLEISADITQRDTEMNGDEYWQLRVTNFDRDRGARCRLEIDHRPTE